MATRMQQRRGTAAQWTAADPILAVAEIGYETDTGQFKIGDGTNHWEDLPYFKNIEDLGGNLDDYILLTEKGAANGVAELDANGLLKQSQVPYLAQVSVHSVSNQADRLSLEVEVGDLSIQTDTGEIYLLTALPSSNNANWTAITVATSVINSHISDTLNVHGIANTAELAVIDDVQNAQSAAEQYADSAVSDHNAETNVHGIANTADLATKDYADGAVSTHSGDTTNVHGIANTADLATQAYADSAASTEASSAVSGHNSDTTNVHGIADTSALALTANVDSALALKQDKVTGVSDTEIGYLDGVTSGIQAQIDGKAASIHTHAQSDITDLVDDLADKAPLDSPTFTGTVTLPSTTSIGDVSSTEIGYVNGVTSAIQTQIDGKASLSGATFTGSVEIDQNLTVDGDLTVNGTTFSASSTTIVIEDNLVQLAHQNAANTVDLGIVVGYNDGSAKHGGVVRDVSADRWKIFKGVTTEPTTTVDFTQGSLDDLEVAGLIASSASIGDVSNTELQYLNGVTSAIQTQIDAKAPLDSPTFTGTVTVAANGIQFTDGTQTKEGVPSRTPISQQTAAYNLSTGGLSLRDSLIEISHTGGTAVELTIPADSTTNFPVGTSIDVLRTNTGGVTIAGAVGVTVNGTPGLKLRAQWSSATLFKRAANTWVVMGDLTA